MRGFLTELAKLMEKYSVNMTAIEETRGYNTYLDRIEFTIDSEYDYKLDKNTRDYCCVVAGTTLCYGDVQDLIKLN